MKSFLILSFVTYILYGHLYANTFQADRDLMLVEMASSEFPELLNRSQKREVKAAKRDQALIKLNNDIFILWLMYVGPWKFQLIESSLVPKILTNIRKAYAPTLLKSLIVYDPINVKNGWSVGKSLQERLPFGNVPNLDLSQVTTHQEYDALIAKYVEWLSCR